MKNKKLLVILLISLVMLLPLKTFAKTYYDGYETKNLKETLEAEGITLENKEYSESKKQATIYLFRGDGCGYCKRFLEFLNSISKEEGKYFKVVSFEVWGNKKNAELLEKVAKVTGEQAGGVPYIVIGKKVFPGYIAEWNDDIKAAIKEQYKDNSYDVFDDVAKADKAANGDSISSTSVVIWNFVFILISTVVIVCFINFKSKKILEAASKRITPSTVVSKIADEVKRVENKKIIKKGKK